MEIAIVKIDKYRSINSRLIITNIEQIVKIAKNN